ncbi:aminoglycoside phosphotransferase family protein [Polymorphospora rubra]|uniref:phosphotransferase family protein n=1 Tax=Polymorphospora rubra TaxID=338584 RepID=UPI0031D12658
MRSRDRDTVARVALATHLPNHRVGTLERLGEGEDNVAYEVDGELILRVSKATDPAPVVEREARLLAAVAAVSPLPVPEPLFTAPELGCLAYRKLPGVPLLALPDRAAYTGPVAAALGRLLGALHAVPVERMAELVEPDHQPLADWLDEAAENHAAVADRLPDGHRPGVAAFLAAPPPDGGYVPVFSHNDLGIEHVLVDPARPVVTGVLDWTDAALVDPAYDFGLVLRDLGPAALETALDAAGRAGPDRDRLRDRATFYARCGVLEDLVYGFEAPDREAYVDKCLATLHWLFPTPDGRGAAPGDR